MLEPRRQTLSAYKIEIKTSLTLLHTTQELHSWEATIFQSKIWVIFDEVGVFPKTIHIYITITTKDLKIYENVNISNAEYTRIILFRWKKTGYFYPCHLHLFSIAYYFLILWRIRQNKCTSGRARTENGRKRQRKC